MNQRLKNISVGTYTNGTPLLVIRKSFFPAARSPRRRSETPVVEDKNTPGVKHTDDH